MTKVAKIARLAPPRPSNSSIRERVTSRPAKQVLSGDYKQGALLPTEAQLGAEFKVSRTALREAVRTLAAKGLAESRQRAAPMNAVRLTTSASVNYRKPLAAHGEVFEAIRMRHAAVARSRMQALLGIATEDLMRIADPGAAAPKRGGTRSG